METLQTLLTALRGLGNFTAFAWSHAPSDAYGVISVDGRTSLWSGDGYTEGIDEGTIDWFTRNPTDTVPAGIEGVLTDAGASWYLNAIQYEEDTGLLHYEWVWQHG